MAGVDHVIGDMHLGGDGAVDGWCWSPTRPGERLLVDLLIDDAVVASGPAGLKREDLQEAGIGDGHHAFLLRLPPGSLGFGAPCLISARDRESGIVFGRRLHEPGFSPEAPREAALQADIHALSGRLAAVFAAPPPRPAAVRLRAAAGELAAVLRSRAAGGGGIAASQALLGRPLDLPVPRAAPVFLLLWAASAPEALRALRAVASAVRALQAATVLAHPGTDARIALLPSLVPGLVLLKSGPDPLAALAPAASLLPPPAGSGQAEGPWLLLLDPSTTPSAAGLADLLARLEIGQIDLALAAELADRAGRTDLFAVAATAPGLLLAVRSRLLQGEHALAPLLACARHPAVIRPYWSGPA